MSVPPFFLHELLTDIQAVQIQELCPRCLYFLLRFQFWQYYDSCNVIEVLYPCIYRHWYEQRVSKVVHTMSDLRRDLEYFRSLGNAVTCVVQYLVITSQNNILLSPI